MKIVIDGFAQAQRAPQGVIVPPLPQPLRQRHRVMMHTPAEVRKWQTMAHELASRQMDGKAPLTGALLLGVAVYLPIPVSFSHKKRLAAQAGFLRPITRPDLSNYIKAIEDSMTGVLWLDDAQIVGYVPPFGKFYGDKPRIEVVVEPFQVPGADAGMVRGLFDGK